MTHTSWSLIFVAVYLAISNYWRGRLLYESRMTVRAQKAWIAAQNKTIIRLKKENEHVIKGMSAFFPEGWDA